MKYYILTLIIIFFDQITKWMVKSSMELYESVEVIPGFFSITSHRNSGAAWGILEGQMWLFYIVTVIVIGIIIYYMQQYKNSYPWLMVGFAIILGGAIGNFIDRIYLQEVIDFIDVVIFGYDFPIFNIADSALTVGVIFVIIMMLIDEMKKKGKNANE
ncbi:signal peptidase II [Tenuibacillus multivorans]|uniref:Lipoprotein signal peptidase n=1 Tax=Tenuibacillus multivorans TaxID=237069 RepID=A0A1G9Y6A8_9BACI|nr:signal peptidase II [Tenuibacillus multivorans]GEL75950.1 lipoprotein signal peptidase [Tenuibacillus multivorans]SDN04091.1 signal peptidase II [Tenuibacillus multivorans]